MGQVESASIGGDDINKPADLFDTGVHLDANSELEIELEVRI